MSQALARSTDPVQSHEAAARSALFAGTHRDRILAALREHGRMCAHELERVTGLTVVQIDRRMHECVKNGVVIPVMQAPAVPLLRATGSGGWAQVFEAVR